MVLADFPPSPAVGSFSRRRGVDSKEYLCAENVCRHVDGLSRYGAVSLFSAQCTQRFVSASSALCDLGKGFLVILFDVTSYFFLMRRRSRIDVHRR